MDPRRDPPQSLRGPHRSPSGRRLLAELAFLLGDDETVKLPLVAERCKEDPGLGAALVGAARASAEELGEDREVRSIPHAVALLGLVRVREIVERLLAGDPIDSVRRAS